MQKDAQEETKETLETEIMWKQGKMSAAVAAAPV
jgi:hypothetical protein